MTAGRVAAWGAAGGSSGAAGGVGKNFDGVGGGGGGTLWIFSAERRIYWYIIINMCDSSMIDLNNFISLGNFSVPYS